MALAFVHRAMTGQDDRQYNRERTMTYYEDLTPFAYHTANATAMGLPVLNVGWLDAGHPFNRGATSAAFRHKLLAFCRDENLVRLMRGFHACAWCAPGEDPSTWLQVKPDYGPDTGGASIGNGEIRVLGAALVYAAPALIYHYVVDHDYRPPDAFIAAVLDGHPNSPEHRALRAALAA